MGGDRGGLADALRAVAREPREGVALDARDAVRGERHRPRALEETREAALVLDALKRRAGRGVERDAARVDERERLRRGRRDDHHVGLPAGALVAADLPTPRAPGDGGDARVDAHLEARGEVLRQRRHAARAAVRLVEPAGHGVVVDPAGEVVRHARVAHGDELGPVVEHAAIGSAGREATAGRASLVEHGDPRALIVERARRHEPRDPGAHDDAAGARRGVDPALVARRIEPLQVLRARSREHGAEGAALVWMRSIELPVAP